MPFDKNPTTHSDNISHVFKDLFFILLRPFMLSGAPRVPLFLCLIYTPA